MTQAGADDTLTYPRQEALTRRFRLGAPRSFAISPDGRRALFIRSASGRDSAGSLWSVQDTGEQTCVVDVRAVDAGDGDLPAAERARRERMREVTSGITAFSVDADFTRAVFVIDGTPFCVSLSDHGARCVELPAPGPVVDPRISPDGKLVAYVHDRAIMMTDADGSGEPRTIAAPEAGIGIDALNARLTTLRATG